MPRQKRVHGRPRQRSGIGRDGCPATPASAPAAAASATAASATAAAAAATWLSSGGGRCPRGVATAALSETGLDASRDDAIPAAAIPAAAAAAAAVAAAAAAGMSRASAVPLERCDAARRRAPAEDAVGRDEDRDAPEEELQLKVPDREEEIAEARRLACGLPKAGRREEVEQELGVERSDGNPEAEEYRLPRRVVGAAAAAPDGRRAVKAARPRRGSEAAARLNGEQERRRHQQRQRNQDWQQDG